MPLPVLGPIIDIVGKVIDRAVPDPVQKAQLRIELAKLADQDAQRAHEEMMGQIATNTAEAQSRSVFVAGWRAFIGWGCGGALIYNTLIAPPFHLAVADLSFLQTVLMAMLGIGAMRSYDKVKGTANDVLPIFPKPVAVTPVAAPAPKKKILGIAPWPF